MLPRASDNKQFTLARRLRCGTGSRGVTTDQISAREVLSRRAGRGEPILLISVLTL